jgi:hypothetical protein
MRDEPMITGRGLLAPLAALLLIVAGGLPASAKILIEIDKSAQRMIVSRDGVQIHQWPVSTGLRAYDTPSGSYTPFRLEEDHYSKEWDDAPMPHSIFFTKKGHAIHGTTHIRNIGRPASHGCVRLEPANARVLFNMVKREGLGNTRVVLTGVVPAVSAPAVARRPAAPVAEPQEEEALPPQRGYYDRGYPPPAPTAGYWVVRPDGSRVYYERDPRTMPPPPFFFPRRPFGSY